MTQNCLARGRQKETEKGERHRARQTDCKKGKKSECESENATEQKLRSGRASKRERDAFLYEWESE